uniref:Methyltransferase FkbM domain-containing protein n=1 Tax=Chrysotila carterae TaxID=13221 RepID=A0A7S4C0H1_CHRCT|mmetsp:Transcript_53660/g.117013  ORF Transcript_53660/g.117013 Transcript_53660/m.117013 type:complete len:229 (+) Transcript_53660:353-1039(+)
MTASRACSSGFGRAPWHFILFEPQAKFASILTRITSNLSPPCTSDFHQAAAWKHDGQLQFVQSRNSQSSYVRPSKDDSAGIRKRINHFITVQSVDISKFIHQALHPTDFVFLKMDIEGAEYDLLPSLIASGALCPVDYFLIEWHLQVVNETKRLEAVGLRLALAHIVERSCPPRAQRRVFEHDELHNNRHQYVRGLWSRAIFHNDAPPRNITRGKLARLTDLVLAQRG